MILQILFILLGILVCFITLILLSPIYCKYTSSKNRDYTSALVIHVIHKAIIEISYSFLYKTYTIVLFNTLKFPSPKKKDKALDKSEDQSTEEDDPIEDELDTDKSEDDLETEKESEDERIDKETLIESEISTGSSEDSNAYSKPSFGSVYEQEIKGSGQEQPAKEDNKEQDIEESSQEQDTKESDHKKETKEDVIPQSEKSDKKVEKPSLKKKFEKFKKIVTFVIDQKKIAVKFTRWIIRIIKNLFRVIKFDCIKFDIKAGFEDPSITGMVYSVYTGVFYTLEIHDAKQLKLNFNPVFTNKDVVTFFQGSLSLKTSLGRLILPITNALLFFPYYSAFILWRRYKKIKKLLKEE